MAVLVSVEMLEGQSFNMQIGFSHSGMTSTYKGRRLDSDFKNRFGFHAGFTQNIPLGSIGILEGGLAYSSKGFVDKFKDAHSEENRHTTRVHYIDAPLLLNLVCREDNSTENVVIGLGGYFSYALSANKYIQAGEEKDYSRVPVIIGEGEDAEIRRWDYGLLFKMGLNLREIGVGFSYSLGLDNISANAEEGYKMQNRSLRVFVNVPLIRKKVIPPPNSSTLHYLRTGIQS